MQLDISFHSIAIYLTRVSSFLNSSPQSGRLLLVVIVTFVVNNVEELELIDTLGGGDDAEPVTELHLLEELLGPSLEVSAAI